MLDLLLQPFSYNYMVKAIWVSAIVGAACAFLSAYLMLKGWSLMGDALSHSVVPGVAGAYALGLPYAAGAFFTGMLAALAMTLVRHITRLREDAIIGFIFSTFFAVGLLIVSLNPTSVNVQSIIFGNILGIADEDVLQVEIIIGVSLLILCLVWKDLLAVFFDESHAVSIGLSPLHQRQLITHLLRHIGVEWPLHVPDGAGGVWGIHLAIDKLRYAGFQCARAAFVGRDQARDGGPDEGPLFRGEKGRLVIVLR